MTSKHFQRLGIACGLLLAVTAWALDDNPVIIKGSNTFGEELGPALIAAFRAQHPDIEFDLSTEGSASGMTALLNGEAHLASASRVASEDELRTARALNQRLRSHFIGSYGVSVIVNSANPVRSLTMEQVRDIFTGVITNWKEIGGPDAAIQCYIRDPVSGTYLGFRELAMEDRPYVDNAKQLLTYTDITDAVQSDRHGVGYTGMTLVPDAGVRAVLVNGIPANAVSVNEGLYPYARGVRFYTIRGTETRPMWSFINFVRARAGQEVLEQQGYVSRTMQRMDTGGIAP